MFAEAFESMLQDHCTLAVVRAAEAGQAPQLLRDVITRSGFLDLLAADGDAAPMLRHCPSLKPWPHACWWQLALPCL